MSRTPVPPFFKNENRARASTSHHAHGELFLQNPEQGGASVARWPHKPEVTGSTPDPATMQVPWTTEDRQKWLEDYGISNCRVTKNPDQVLVPWSYLLALLWPIEKVDYTQPLNRRIGAKMSALQELKDAVAILQDAVARIEAEGTGEPEAQPTVDETAQAIDVAVDESTPPEDGGSTGDPQTDASAGTVDVPTEVTSDPVPDSPTQSDETVSADPTETASPESSADGAIPDTTADPSADSPVDTTTPSDSPLETSTDSSLSVSDPTALPDQSLTEPDTSTDSTPAPDSLVTVADQTDPVSDPPPAA